ncbi:hypothetical protein [Enterococcus faecalis]|uniref:hypothetical protein n=1 Tax=Enterococcus faecalis TaxID=1351 RepID=UPI00046C5F0A|nr:hypothetical protein [Enterococcus faecalis]EKZ0447618.1 hypothetical protein [Enterococcus faecalis]ELT8936890.1 hypothetical protein [Enterococcus faecalis]KXF69503.1 hypothetical protein AQ486_13730 [Enterococcus faecalis]MBC2813084.1 hypothetical protein [Enterococcus faecalis]
MTEKVIIKIRDIDRETSQRLVKVAKEKGYSGRDEMLRDILKKIAYEEFQLETEIRYQAFTKDVVETMQLGMEILAMKMLEPGKTFDEMENEK